MPTRNTKKPSSTKSDKRKAPEPLPLTIPSETHHFVSQLSSLLRAIPLAMKGILEEARKAEQDFDAFMDERVVKRSKGGKETSVFVKGDDISRFTKLRAKRTSASMATVILPRSFVVSLVSIFDAFLGALIEALYYLQPNLLNASEKKLSLTDLLAFGSIEGARKFIIEKEVEGVLRDSHTDQFKWLENKFSIALRKELDCWPTFIEVTERRNLFVHTNGRVSSQYLAICRENGVSLDPKLQVGDGLQVAPQYIGRAYACLFEIGAKLSQVLWRKLRSDQLEEADSLLNEIAFELLQSGQYDLAKRMFAFAAETLKKHGTEEMRRMFVINLAIAHKWSGENKKCQEILSNEDWSSSSQKFGLAVAVLKDDFKTAADLMKKIGAEDVPKEAYQEWPLFKEFRKTDKFTIIYKEIFGMEFALPSIERQIPMNDTREGNVTAAAASKLPDPRNAKRVRRSGLKLSSTKPPSRRARTKGARLNK